GQACDDDQRAGGVGSRHAGDDPERDEQPVLGAEHELADAREAPDPGRFAERVLLDVPPRLSARVACGWGCGATRRTGAFRTGCHVAEPRPGLAGAGGGGVMPCGQTCQREALRRMSRSWRPMVRASERPPWGLKKSATASWASAR